LRLDDENEDPKLKNIDLNPAIEDILPQKGD
jgi:hypothetical protein